MQSKRRYASIPAHVLMYMAWRNLVSKKLRSFLTMLGVMIGIGAIFFLFSLGLGLQSLVTNEIIGNQSIKSIDVTSPNSRILKLDNAATDKIGGLPHVSKIGSSYAFAGGLKFNSSEVDTIVYGVDKGYQELANLNLTKGRMLEANDGDAVFVNRSVLQAVGINNPEDILDKKLNLKIPLHITAQDGSDKAIDQSFAIVGVIDSGSGNEVFIPKTYFDLARVDQFSQVKLLADDTANISGLRKQIESLGFETTSPMDTIDQINQMFKYFNIVLVGFGAIGMIVAVLGMFNTLTISLLERTREIGLMVALGARHKDMRKLFVLEAVLLSFIGAVFGIILAMIGGQFVNIGMNQLAMKRGVTDRFDLFATPPWLIASLIGFMVLVGLIVVFFPARRAEHINPIDALRRE